MKIMSGQLQKLIFIFAYKTLTTPHPPLIHRVALMMKRTMTRTKMRLETRKTMTLIPVRMPTMMAPGQVPQRDPSWTLVPLPLPPLVILTATED